MKKMETKTEVTIMDKDYREKLCDQVRATQ